MFPANVQLVTVGLLLLALYIPPPPLVAEFPLNVQLLTVGLPPELNNPPPNNNAAFPAVMVKPSSTAVASVPVPVTT